MDFLSTVEADYYLQLYYYKRIWPENWVDGGGLGITIRNEPWETVLTSIPLSGRGVGNAAGHVKISPKF